MKTKLGVLLLLLAAALAPAQTNNLTALLQQGLFEEQANRNLDAAIADYQSLATQFDKDRSLAATAIFRLGECYRAQGRTNEAAAQYQRILHEFPDQQTLATLSRQDLAGLGIAAQPRFQERLQAIIAKVPAGSATASENPDTQLWDRVKELPENQLEKVLPTLVPDAVLTKLEQQRDDAETKLAELRELYNTNNVDVVREEAVLKTIDRQIFERIEGMMQALKISAELFQTAATTTSPSTGEISAEARLLAAQISGIEKLKSDPEEQARSVLAMFPDETLKKALLQLPKLQEQVGLVKANPQLTLDELLKTNGYYVAVGPVESGLPKTSVTNLLADAQGELGEQVSWIEDRVNFILGIQKARLKVLQTVAGSVSTPSATQSGAASAPADEEDQEIRRIQEMIQNSPDLINGDPLCRAASAGELRVATFLLDHGANVNALSGGETPLISAANSAQKTMVELLLGRGADINARDASGGTALLAATRAGYQAVVEVLLAHKANVNMPYTKMNNAETPLHLAAERGYASLVSLLLANGADVNATNDDRRTPLHPAAESGWGEIVQMLLHAGANPNVADNRDRTPLSYAAEHGSPEMVKTLLAAKADPNGGKLDTPLLVAIHKQDAASAQLLLQAGANPNAKSEDDWQPNAFGAFGHPVGRGWDTPVFSAIAMDQFPMVQLLLKYKADPNGSQPDGGPLIFAALPHLDILKALLDAGADPNLPHKDARNFLTSIPAGTSPLTAAIGNSFYETLDGNLAAAKLLLAHGADPNARNQSGDTALHWAVNLVGNWKISPARRELVELLLDHHADPNVKNNNGKTPLDLLKEIGAQNSSWPSVPENLPEQKVFARELADLLRQHGALDNLPSWDRIEISRATANFQATIFRKGTNHWNQFSLLELIAVQYQFLSGSPQGDSRKRDRADTLAVNSPNYRGADALAFADLSHVHIHRPSPDGKNWQDLSVDLKSILDAGDCTKDVRLQWGDMVEIPETDHPLNDLWRGFSHTELANLAKCLTRQVQVVVKGQTTSLTLAPEIDNNDYVVTEAPFWIGPVLRSSNLLLASSDLSRVKITRRDLATGKAREWIMNCSGNNAPGLWLRDGDVIEVPEKP